ncbi:retrovirus-related pol polyprotein from transposon TNT 1-94 [Tanacetum coccineum]
MGNVKKDIDEIEQSTLNWNIVFAITTLKNELRKLKRKNVVNTAVLKPNATVAPGMFKVDIEPISARLKNNRDAHEVYIEKTIEYVDTLHGFVERELLVYASQTCPNSPKPSENLVAVTPTNNEKRVRFAEPVTSSNNIPKQTDSLKTKDSNKPLLTSTGVKPTTSASGSNPSGNTKNNRITQPPHSNQKNKVEYHLRKLKSSLNKMNSISEPISNTLVKHSVRNGTLVVSKHMSWNLSSASMNFTSPVCLLSKASKAKSWLWHRRLSHLNFGTINKLAKDGLERGIPKLKFQKDHLWSACALGKSKKSSHQPKAEDTN